MWNNLVKFLFGLLKVSQMTNKESKREGEKKGVGRAGWNGLETER